jgi:CheY-like chemotaxis protein
VNAALINQPMELCMKHPAVLSKTGLGFSELTNRKLGLPREAYRVLQYVDGQSSTTDLLLRLDGLPEAALMIVLDQLLEHRLVRATSLTTAHDLTLPNDADTSVVELDPEESVQAWAAAKRGSKELEDTGFFASSFHPFKPSRNPAILLVEDDPHVAQLVVILLEDEGFSVVHVASGKALVSKLALMKPDLVVLDVMLPDTTGFKILSALRSNPIYQSMPVIMLTASTTEADVMCGLHGGADGYIFKPFKPQALVTCIRQVLEL